tara:strand:- start:88 stop:399 length:312 start_codon:yes stop_codon:yes gene_type:complete
MRTPDCETNHNCRVIPFVRPTYENDPASENGHVLASSIAAIIAVTILHKDGESPEARLLDIIEGSGDAEIIDVIDVIEEFQALGISAADISPPANDNAFLGSL